MIGVAAFFLIVQAGATSSASLDLQTRWQTCVRQTSELWSTKPVSDATVVDAAIIHCREELEALMIANLDEMKEIGLNQAQAEEAASIMTALVLRMIRDFALDAVHEARQSK